MTITGWIIVDKNGRQCSDSYASTRRVCIANACGQTAWSALYKMGYRCVKMTGGRK